MKRCRKCGELKPFSAYTKHKMGKDGLRPRCRSCLAVEATEYRASTVERRREYNRLYRLENREKHLEYNKAWNAAHPDKMREAERRYRARIRGANPPPASPRARRRLTQLDIQQKRAYVAAQKRAWKLAHPEEVAAQKRRHSEKNREKIVARVREWRRKNPDKHRAQNLLRRSQQRDRGGRYTTAEKMRARRDFYGGRCFYCGKAAISYDHRIPLARGGLHLPANLVPACKSCNSRKNTLTQTEFQAKLAA